MTLKPSLFLIRLLHTLWIIVLLLLSFFCFNFLMMGIDSLIFDLDGTLWDSCYAISVGWTRALKKLNLGHYPSKQDVQGICGLQYLDCCQKLFPDLTIEKIHEIRPILEEEEQKAIKEFGGELYPDVFETIVHLSKKFPLFIVSNCQDWYLDLFLEKFSFHKYFKDWESYGRTQLSKAENISLIKHRNHLKNPIYIGDTSWDREACLSAQVPFLYASYGFGKFNHNVSIRSFSDLKDILSVK